MVLKRISIIVALAFCTISCTPSYRGVPGQPPFAAELEPYEEAVDSGCAYFNFLWGKSAELEGRADEAIYAYKQALLCDRRADYVMRTLAMVLIKSGQRAEAVEWVNKLVALNPKDVGARSLLANLYSAMERPEEAIRIYEEILAEDPANFNIMLMLGGLYARHRQYDKAQQTLEQLVARNKDSYAGYYYLAKLYQEQGMFDKAMAAYERALAINWSAMLAYEAADLYEQQERFAEAIDIYRRILSEDAADERAHSYLANAFLRQGKVDQAIEELETLRSYAADVDKVDYSISRILIDSERYKEGIARLSAILERNPEFQGARSLLILAYYQSGDMEATKRILRQVKPVSNAYEESVLMLARILQDEKDVAGAERFLLEVMADSEHRHLNFYVGLAMLYYEQGERAKAQQVFDRAFVDFPGNVEVFYEYALYLHKAGDVAASMAQMEEVLKRDPSHAHALNYVGYTWAEEGRNLEQAKAYIEKAVSLLPKDGFVRDSLGWIYYQLGDYARAVAELERAVELSQGDPTIYEHLAEAYLQSGDVAAARDAYEKAIELYEEDEKKEEVRRKLSQLPENGNAGKGK